MSIAETPPSTLTQIMQLENMAMKELLVIWQEFNQTSPPVRARSYIERRLPYAL
ncbi:hypothetical protein [Agarilytica rhodophyticola]|uniref:hypothetical protein n=1 Tax=Agarilytica rhodophyticola TaxID=1737490 RepID=UPI0013158CB2|nr:hypothetical protein [Agarilytica rhodophyticola]